MRSWQALVSRLRYLGRRARMDRELAREIRFHVDARSEELERAGVPAAAARARAAREFGSVARAAEGAREAWQFQWLANLQTDMRHAARGFRRSPVFAVTAVVCLALGIGLTTLIFSVVNAAFLRSLPYPAADRLVVLWFTRPNQPNQKFGTNTGAYFAIREHNHVFEQVGAGRFTNNTFNVADEASGSAGRERILAQWLSPDMIGVFGVNPAMGRWPNDEDTAAGVFSVTISHGLWQRIFGGAPDVIGKRLHANGWVTTIVGVMPPGFELLEPADLWIRQTDANLRTAVRSPTRIFTVIGRLKPGVTLAQAQAEMTGIATTVAREFPETHDGWTIRVEPLRDAYVGRLRLPLLLFQGAVLFVLLIASANVAGLQLAQAAARQRELAMRAALGSSRERLVRQLLAESAVLALAGGALGVGLAWGGLRLIAHLSPVGLARFGVITLDGTVLAFSLLLSAGSGLLFGLFPAIQISRTNAIEVLRESSRSTATRVHQRARGAFVVVQVALALVLLIGAGLAINSLTRLNIASAGFDPRRLTTFQVTFADVYRLSPTGSGGRPLGDGASGGLLVDVNQRIHLDTARIAERLSALPGVESVALAVTPPLGTEPVRIAFSEDGRPVASAEQQARSAEWYPIGPGYFRTLKVPLISGREFVPDDGETRPPVAIVNAAMAQQFWPGEDPIGKRIQMRVLFDAPREIVGVVGDVRQNRYQRQAQPQVYFPRVQLPRQMDMSLAQSAMVTTFVLRTGDQPSSLGPVLRSTVAGVNPTLAVSRIRTVEDYASAQLQDLRQYSLLLSIFGGISVALAIVGLFGVTAQAVSLRTNEIGIRRALGAGTGAVLRLIVGEAARLVGIGLVLGVGASLVLTRSTRSLLWGVASTDPMTYVVVAVALGIVALLACYLPARKALTIDPLKALRSE
jgi:putative ABC transport system permease protein